MEPSRPAELKGIVFEKTEITGTEFKILKKPGKDVHGYIKFNLNILPEFKAEPETKLPHSFKLKTEALLQAFSGDMGKSPPEGEELMSCKVQLVLNYRIQEPHYTDEEIKKYLWCFQSQAAVVVRGYLRDLLRDTAFASIPIHVDA
ncbi:MAG: hypothetical protein WC381_08235 [Kiritimatiellia bacterium]|jgi:hypothetical protein